MADLIPGILAHAFGGVLVACGIWAVGLGCLPRPERRTAAFAYPLGLLVSTVAVTLFMLTPWLGIASLALVTIPLLRLIRLRPAEIVRDAAAATAALPAAIGLGVALGWIYRPPTANAASGAYGDYVFYAVRLDAAARSIVPFHDLTVEGGRATYLEGAPTFIGAALSHVPGFDPFLFGAASLPAFLVFALAIGMGVSGARSTYSWALALLGIACIAYPSWLTESAPVALALPLGFALYALWRFGAPRGLWLILLCALAVDFALTKGVGLLTFGVAAPFALIRHFGFQLRPALRYVVAAAVIIAASVITILATSAWIVHILGVKFLPADAIRGLNSELHVRDTEAVTPALRVIGESLLLAALVRARLWLFAAACATAIASTWFIGGHGLDTTVGFAVLLAVLVFRDEPAAFRRAKPLALAASGVLALSSWFRDISGVRSGSILVGLFGLGLLAVLAPQPVKRAAVVPAVLLAVVAPFLVSNRPQTLSRFDYQLWRHAERVVPKDGLVFTSLTGPEKAATDQGQSFYPAIAGRQLYLAGWANSPLLVDRGELQRRLALNRDVLEGRLAPQHAHLSRHYAAYFAVLRDSERAPAAFRPLYANDEYVLYRIES